MTDKPPAARPSREDMTSAEREAATRADLYLTHKARGSLGTYYEMYPDERPKTALRFYEQDNAQDHGRER